MRSIPLVLASTSIYRRELLGRLRLPFTVVSPDVDETQLAGEDPGQTAVRLARAKASAVARQHPRALVIGSDQTSSIDGREVLTKPGSIAAAREQLRRAAGKNVRFHTAFAVVRHSEGLIETGCVPTDVRFRRLEPSAIDTYLTLEPALDCVGSARIEGLGIALIESVHSEDPTALIGLPLIALTSALARAGIEVLHPRHPD